MVVVGVVCMLRIIPLNRYLRCRSSWLWSVEWSGEFILQRDAHCLIQLRNVCSGVHL